ncbi:hypothetical protein ACFE04_002566 [Oxalis oulophora]
MFYSLDPLALRIQTNKDLIDSVNNKKKNIPPKILRIRDNRRKLVKFIQSLCHMHAGDPRLWTTTEPKTIDVIVFDKRAEMGRQLKKAITMTLRQLLDEYDTSKLGTTYVCTAKVDDIECDRSWCYQGCKFCTRSLEHYENSYWCKKCGVVDGAFSRFRANLNIVDGDSSAFFLLF